MLFKPAEKNNHNSFLQEKVILKTRPHWIIPAFWLFLLLLWLVLFNIALEPLTETRAYPLYVSIALLLLAAPFILLDWLFNCFCLTDKRAAHSQGFIWKNYKVIPIKRIQNISYHQGILGELFDFGNLTVESAGTSFGVMILYGIPSPRKLAIKIYEQIQMSKNNGF